MPKLKLNLKSISDRYDRDNFEKVQEVINGLEETIEALAFALGDFKFFEFDIKGTHNDFKLRHNLGFAPNDILVTRAVGSPYDFQYEQFTSDTLSIKTTGDLYLRCFVGNMRGGHVTGPRAGLLASAGPGAGFRVKTVEVDGPFISDRTIELNDSPPPGGVLVRLNGMDVPATDFSLSGNVVTIDNDYDIELGDTITVQYSLT